MNLAASRLIVLPHASAYRRLIGIVAGVAVATAMLFILLGTYLHLPDRADRVAWTQQTSVTVRAPELDDRAIPRDDAILLAMDRGLAFGEVFHVVTTAATPTTTVAFPGGLDAPQPSQYYASPAMQALIESVPRDQLADRYGTFAGYIPDDALKGSTQLLVLAGVDWASAAAAHNTSLVEGFETNGARDESISYRIIIAIGAIALLVPIVLLVGIVSQLGAAARRERFATVRLVGAGRKQVAALSALEMGLATLAGSVLGVAVMFALRPAAALIRFGGTESFVADLTPPAWAIVATIAGVTALGAASAWIRTFRDDVGALSSTRERPEKRATAWRLVPIFAGLASLTLSSTFATRIPTAVAVLGILGGFALVAFGVIFAGSYLTRLLASVVRRLSRSAPSLVAAGRLGRHPRATFRSVAGLVVAVFIVSMFAGMSSVVDAAATPRDVPGALVPGVVMGELDQTAPDAAAVLALERMPGVERVIVAGHDDDWAFGRIVLTEEEARALGALDVPESELVVLDAFSLIMAGTDREEPAAPQAFAGAAPAPSSVFVLTDGSDGSVERARTALLLTGALTSTPLTRAEFADAGASQLLNELAIMAYIGMAIAVAISAIALAVATIASALDRKRTFGLLRLAGMPVGYLRRVIATEAAVPLAGMIAWSAGLGFLVAWLLVGALMPMGAMRAPDARYWLAMFASVGIGAVAITSSFGMVRRSTEVASTRFE
jgi:hypothetical protein